MHEIGGTAVAGRLGQLEQRRRRHEQGVAPAPAVGAGRCALAGRDRDEFEPDRRPVGEDMVEIGAYRRDRFLALAILRRPQPRLTDQLIGPAWLWARSEQHTSELQ